MIAREPSRQKTLPMPLLTQNDIQKAHVGNHLPMDGQSKASTPFLSGVTPEVVRRRQKPSSTDHPNGILFSIKSSKITKSHRNYYELI
jgi:hypothetical protein